MTHRSPLLSFHAVAMLGAALGACTFHPPAATDASDPPPAVDAPLEAIQRCTPGEKLCRGRDLEECNATGTDIDPTKTQSCGLGCVEGAHCVEASNIPRSTQTQCTSSAPKLEPPAGATVTIEASRITCSPTCGSSTSIDPVESHQQPEGPRLAVYCLSGVSIPADVTVGTAPGIQAAIAWLVAGNVQIDGTIDIGGGAATDTAAGAAGPAAGGGGTLANENQAGRSGGRGNCGGRGGAFADTPTPPFPSTAIGGGGGGGGHSGAGGTGGRGRQAGTTANGGGAGEVCSVDSLIPLAGGGGGGSGGDGTCGTQCGWPGGGGGGALQISATGTISLPATGSIRAGGGAGFGSDNNDHRRGGGGGGGAGGAVLLEALNLTLAGAIRVTGGAGGNSGAGAGGTGAAGAMLTGGAGTNEDSNEEGGAGGGGGAGRVRVNTVGASCPSSIEPTGSCAPGGLRATPAP